MNAKILSVKNFLAILLLLIISSSYALAEEEVKKAGFGTSCLLTKTLNVDELKDYAGIIFRGKFLGYEYAKDKNLNIRKLKFEVIDPIKGLSENQETLTLKEWAKFQSPFVDGTVAKNQEYVFFFHQPSKRDLTSLTGLDQGIATVDASNNVKFSKRLNMKKKNSLKKKLFSSTEVNQDVEINSYQDLKKYFSN